MKLFPLVRSSLRAAFAAALLFSLGACATNTHAPGKPQHPSALCTLKDDNGHPIPAAFTGTSGTTHRSHAANHVNVVARVQSACCDGFDRLVFEMDGFHQATYTVKYAQPPFSDCGSGMTHAVAGRAWLQIQMTPAQAHTDEGKPTVLRDQQFHCANLKALAVTCDFEADTTFVIGLKSKKPYRVIELQNPTRLVVDVKH